MIDGWFNLDDQIAPPQRPATVDLALIKGRFPPASV